MSYKLVSNGIERSHPRSFPSLAYSRDISSDSLKQARHIESHEHSIFMSLYMVGSSSSVRDPQSGWESSSGGGLAKPPACLCGAQATIQTSLTEGNPGELFYGCPFFKGTPASTLEMKATCFVVWAYV